ncbi:MAG: methyltransferase [Deltaproteobacteria bacterium]|nr:MAG: methyltransferase [Deltaproteobacteria bacterium]
MKHNGSERWLPKGYPIVCERVCAGGLNVHLNRVKDPNALSDSIDEEAFGADERFPYWAEIWPSSVALASRLSRTIIPSGATTVELGCGTGLAGVAAAMRGADVLFTDYEADALAFARANHALNTGRVGRSRLFDWREPPRGFSAQMVIASDVLYEERFLEPFLATLRRLLLPGGTAWVAEPGRKIAVGTIERLEAEGYQRALYLEEVTVRGRSHGVWLHRIVRPHKKRGGAL